MTKSKVAFITAIFGGYEKTCKPFKKQIVSSDFICFTDDLEIEANGWIIDTNPYHVNHPSIIDNGAYINSIKNNKHTFNIAKYYKQSWHNIPRLNEYEVVIWLDGTTEILKGDVAEYMIFLCKDYKIVGWNHEHRNGSLISEVEASSVLDRYTSDCYLNQVQPIQDIIVQYQEYLELGYSEDYWSKVDRLDGRGSGDHFGVWITNFVAFLNCSEVIEFLDHWYLQTLKYTTQDQVGFPFTVQGTGLIPYTLPDKRFYGDNPHKKVYGHKKHQHGK